MMSTKYEKIKLLIYMVLAYVLLLVGVVNSYPMHTTTDELGGIAGAAFFAGLDWSGVIANSGYYGFGYYSLFSPLFRITDSPIVIYRIIVMFTVFLRIAIIPISYYIMKNYLNIKSEWDLYLFAFLMPFLHTSTVGIISNEYILELIIWLVLLLMCKTIQHLGRDNKGLLYSFLLICICLYSLFIHTRALTLLIALFIVFIAWGIINKNKKVIFIIFSIPSIYIIAKQIITLYQQRVYGASGSSLRNGSVSVSNTFSFLDKNTWDVWGRMIVGLLDTETIITGGLFLLCVVVTIYYIFSIVQKNHNQQLLPEQGNMILAVTVLCIGATIAAFLVSGWFEGMLSTWGEVGAEKEYAYKGLTYVRYWNVYVPAFIMCNLALLTKLNYKKVINYAVVCLIVLHIIFICKVLHLVAQNIDCASFLFGIGHYEWGMQVSVDYYLKCIAISLFITLIAYAIVQTQFRKYAIIPFIILMICFHFNEQLEYNLEIKQRISSKILASYEEKCRLDKDNIDIGTIYLNDETAGTDANWKIYSVAQFYFNRYTLQVVIPPNLDKDDIIISTGRSQTLESQFKDIKCYVLDENEVWYTYLELPDYLPINMTGE